MTDDTSAEQPGSAEPRPAGDVYDWFRRGQELLKSGNPAAAAQVLAHAATVEPESRSIAESLARAQFDAKQYDESAATFRAIVEGDPSDDYARFGLGLSCARLGDLDTAVEQLALAVAMRPDRRHYADALRNVRSTLEARRGLAS